MKSNFHASVHVLATCKEVPRGKQTDHTVAHRSFKDQNFVEGADQAKDNFPEPHQVQRQLFAIL